MKDGHAILFTQALNRLACPFPSAVNARSKADADAAVGAAALEPPGAAFSTFWLPAVA